MKRIASLGVLAFVFGLPVAAQAADYSLSLESTGLRDYYCQITVALENHTDAPLTEINGYFYAYIGAEKAGRSKGAGFVAVAPKGRTEATFETPNAPCDQVERYEFVIGACRIGTSFEDQAACAARMSGTGKIKIVVPG